MATLIPYNPAFMYRDTLLAFYDDYAGAIRENRESAVVTGDPEAFHRLRVAMKKTRALLNVIGALTVDFDGGESYRGLRKLFRAAGGVRDLQVQHALASEIEPVLNISLGEYKRSLLDRQLEEKEVFREREKQFRDRRLDTLRDEIGKATSGIDDQTARTLALSRIRTLVNEFGRWGIDLPTADLHELRTITKQTFYSWDLIEKAFPGTLVYPRPKERLHELQRLLGKWHDYEVAMLFSGADHSRSLRGDEAADDYRAFYAYLRLEKQKIAARVKRRWKRARRDFEKLEIC